MATSTQNTGAIVLNRMFVGDYCIENIGHEIINVFRADNGGFYVYLNSTGDFAYDKKGRVKHIILTRNCTRPNTVQIIGKAKVVAEIYDPQHNKVDQNDDPRVKGICYGGASIVDLFKANRQVQNIYITYEVDEIVEPAKDLFLSFDIPSDSESTTSGNTLYINKGQTETCAMKMARASLKQYVDRSGNPVAHQVLLDAINEPSYWKKHPVEKVSIEDYQNQYRSENFFKICRIQNDELSYSNAFAYLAKKYRREFCLFAKTVLGVTLSENFEIHREKWNIDILIADEKNVLVLENKVMSHVNGLWFDRSANQEQSQLKKYYDIVTGNENRFNTENEYTLLSPHFYILAPNHSNIDKNKYEKGDLYKMVTYSKVRDFIKSCNSNDPFVEQLLLAMEPHCQNAYDFYSDMKASFLEQCKMVCNSANLLAR